VQKTSPLPNNEFYKPAIMMMAEILFPKYLENRNNLGNYLMGGLDWELYM